MEPVGFHMRIGQKKVNIWLIWKMVSEIIKMYKQHIALWSNKLLGHPVHLITNISYLLCMAGGSDWDLWWWPVLSWWPVPVLTWSWWPVPVLTWWQGVDLVLLELSPWSTLQHVTVTNPTPRPSLCWDSNLSLTRPIAIIIFRYTYIKYLQVHTPWPKK